MGIELLQNIGIVAVGISIAAIGMLGFVVFFNDRQSVTNQTFLIFAVLTIIWSIFNFLVFQVHSPQTILWVLRISLFFAVWHTFSFFQLFYVFPQRTVRFPVWYGHILVPAAAFVSILTLLPAVFSGIDYTRYDFQILNGPAIPIFTITVMGFILAGLYFLITKRLRATGEKVHQFKYIFMGSFATFALLIVLNLILPTFLNNTSFAPIGALFMLPFVVCTAYAIIVHKWLDIKVLGTEAFAFTLTLVILAQTTFSHGVALIANIVIFILVFFFGILLVKSVIKEYAARMEVEKLAKELAIANSHLKDLDKRKSEFVSIASHQLRTPLTAIKGYSSMMLEGSFGAVSTEAKEAIDRIFQSTQRLLIIIEDFLTISKIEQGQLTFNIEPVNMAKLLKDLVGDMKISFEQKGLRFKLAPLELAPDQYEVMADAGKILQVIGNVIDNSLKYTPKGGITVKLTRNNEKNRIVIAIADTGVGLTPATKDKLFQKFSRAEDAAKINTSGSGLGLYVAQQIILAHNGKIWADSPGEGKGTTFFIELPAL